MAKPLFNEEIKPAIIEQLKLAKQSINIVIAWFNDKDIYDVLIDKANSGEISINMILAEEEEGNDTNSQLDFKKLIDTGDNVYVFKIPRDRVLVHDKFCVIDGRNIIMGSYNWTYGAYHNNKENAILLEDEPDVCKRFIEEYTEIYDEYCLPIINESIGKISVLTDGIIRDIKHGNIRLAIDIDEIISKISTGLQSTKNQGSNIPTNINDLDYEITEDINDDLLLQWWIILPNEWKKYFLTIVLTLPENHLPSVPVLRSLLSAINKLNFKNNYQIEKLDGLINNQCITEINGSITNLTSLKHINTIQNLELLSLTNSKIKSILESTMLTKIKTLDVSSNKIESIVDICENNSIERLVIDDNPLASFNGLEKLTALTAIICDMRFDNIPMEIDRFNKLGLITRKIINRVIGNRNERVLKFTKT
jgi:hypothetical protein